jgi:hypothetical protein
VKSFPKKGLAKSLGAFEALPAATAAPLTWGPDNA